MLTPTSQHPVKSLKYPMAMQPVPWDETALDVLADYGYPLLTCLSRLPERSLWYRVDAATTVISKPDLDALGSVYFMRNPDGIRRFVERNPALVGALWAVPCIVQEYFWCARLSLELSADPEEPDFVELVLWIGTNYDPVTAVEQLMALHRDSWVRSDSCPTNLCLNVEPL